jgi:hypothetical protein
MDIYEQGGEPAYVQPVEIADVLRVPATREVSIEKIMVQRSRYKPLYPRLRALVDIDVCASANHAVVLKRVASSHLVHIFLQQASPGWHGTTVIDCADVHINTNRVHQILHDVLLDIAMAQSWPRLVTRARQQGSFNERKWRVACASNRVCTYAPLAAGGATYISLAAFARDAGGTKIELSDAECVTYDSLWKQVFADLLLDGEEVSTHSLMTGEQIKRSLPKVCRQLSSSRLEDAVRAAKPGRYLLVIARRTPREFRHATYIARQLVGSWNAKWHANRFRLYPLDMYHRIARFCEYCDVIPVIVRMPLEQRFQGEFD